MVLVFILALYFALCSTFCNYCNSYTFDKIPHNTILEATELQMCLSLTPNVDLLEINLLYLQLDIYSVFSGTVGVAYVQVYMGVVSSGK